MSETVKEEVLRICLRTVCNVLIDEAKNDKTGKINIYSNLLSFYSRLFSICSRKLFNMNDELVNLEKIYPGSKLIEIYFSILYTGTITDILLSFINLCNLFFRLILLFASNEAP